MMMWIFFSPSLVNEEEEVSIKRQRLAPTPALTQPGRGFEHLQQVLRTARRFRQLYRMSPRQFQKLCLILGRHRLLQQKDAGRVVRKGVPTVRVEERVLHCLDWLAHGHSSIKQSNEHQRASSTIIDSRHLVLTAIIDLLYPVYVTQDPQRDYAAPASRVLNRVDKRGNRLWRHFEGLFWSENMCVILGCRTNPLLPYFPYACA